MNAIILSLIILAVSGCASTEAVYKNYARLVDTADGVDSQEAKIIAQKSILEVQEKRNYRVSVPDVFNTVQAQKYPDYWFIIFGHNWLSPISMDPTAKTYTDLRETQYVVVIEKRSGDIKFSGEWYQKRQNDFDWVFDTKGYKSTNPLALPPAEAGHKIF